MGGGQAFEWKLGQMIMVGLLLMVGCFYAGTLYANNATIYASQLSSSSSPTSPGLFSLSPYMYVRACFAAQVRFKNALYLKFLFAG